MKLKTKKAAAELIQSADINSQIESQLLSAEETITSLKFDMHNLELEMLEKQCLIEEIEGLVRIIRNLHNERMNDLENKKLILKS